MLKTVVGSTKILGVQSCFNTLPEGWVDGDESVARKGALVGSFVLKGLIGYLLLPGARVKPTLGLGHTSTTLLAFGV